MGYYRHTVRRKHSENAQFSPQRIQENFCLIEVELIQSVLTSIPETIISGCDVDDGNGYMLLFNHRVLQTITGTGLSISLSIRSRLEDIKVYRFMTVILDRYYPHPQLMNFKLILIRV